MGACNGVCDISRRTFVKAAGATAALAAAGTSVAVADETAAMTPGTYTARAKGFGGYVDVEVTVSEDAIESVKMTGTEPQESELVAPVGSSIFDYAWWVRTECPQMYDSVAERLPQRIVDAQSVNVDAVCGATFTSNAVLSAVRDCIEQAGGNLDDFSVEPAKVDETRDLGEFDVIVVGAGTSGSTAAARAADLGAKVLLIEKSGRVGGAGAVSDGPCCLGSQVQLDNGWDNDVDAYYESVMKISHQCVNGVLVKDFLNRTAHTVDWLAEKGGFEWLPASELYTMSDPEFGDCLVGYAESSVLGTMVGNAFKKLVEPVDTVLYETELTEVVQDETGAVTGIVARAQDGATVTASAKAVVLCCGGFAGDAEKLVKYTKYPFLVFGMMQNKGTTIDICEQVGAQLEHVYGGVEVHYGDVLGEIGDEFNEIEKSALYSMSMAPQFVHVNRLGMRYHDEMDVNANLIKGRGSDTYQGNVNYMIVSKAQMDALATGGLQGVGWDADPAVHFYHYQIPCDYKLENIEAILESAVANGFACRGETLEELADAAGFDRVTFAESMERYAQACEAGVDDLFSKDAAWLFPMGDEGPFYAVECVIRPYNTFGGPKVDPHFRVLDMDNKVIPGLYSAGCDTMGNIVDGIFYTERFGISLGWCFNSGYAAGEYAVTDQR